MLLPPRDRRLVTGTIAFVTVLGLTWTFLLFGSAHPASGQATEPIGVIGCSNTRQATEAYRFLSNVDSLVNTAQDGQGISEWANDSNPWRRYDELRPVQGYEAAWVNLCELAEVGLSQDDVLKVIEKVRRRDPDAAIYLSPLNFYESEDCRLTGGNTIPDQGAGIADAVSATETGVSRGPDLGPLAHSDLAEDVCHLNISGQELVGTQLVEFFDGEQVATTTSTLVGSSTSNAPGGSTGSGQGGTSTGSSADGGSVNPGEQGSTTSTESSRPAGSTVGGTSGEAASHDLDGDGVPRWMIWSLAIALISGAGALIASIRSEHEADAEGEGE